MYIAQFPDGTRIQLPRAAHDTLALMGRITAFGERRLNDIRSSDEMASAVASFCRDLAAASSQAADALAWSVFGKAAAIPE